MNEKAMKKAIVKFCQSKFENHFSAKCFISLLPTDTFITTSKIYACKQKTAEGRFR